MPRNALLDLRQMHQPVCQEPKSDKFAILLIYGHNVSKLVILLKCKVHIENYLPFVFFAFLVEICWSTVRVLCFLTCEIHKTQKYYFNFESSLPLLRKYACLCKSSCSHIMLYQKADLAFTSVDPFIHQFYPLTQQAKNPAGFTEMWMVEKGLYCFAAPGRTCSAVGHDGTRILCITFILAISYVLKKNMFTNVPLPSYQNSG